MIFIAIFIFNNNFSVKYSIQAVCFTSKDGKGRTKLKHSINSKTRDVSYVHNNPIESSHRHFKWRKELKECSIKKDDKPLIESIKKKK